MPSQPPSFNPHQPTLYEDSPVTHSVSQETADGGPLQPALFDVSEPLARVSDDASAEVDTSRPWVNFRRAAFDLETTGPDPHAARIVTASVVLVEPDGTVTREWEWLANPGVEIPEAAAAIHGITTQRAQSEGQRARDVVVELTKVLKELWDSSTPVLAFNAPYDLTVVTRECERYQVPGVDPYPVLDPLVLNKHVQRFRKGKRTLSALCAEYKVALHAAHTSAADALATERLATAMTQQFPELQAPATQLHEAQIGWARDQAASLQEYFRRRNPEAWVDGSWPVHPRD